MVAKDAIVHYAVGSRTQDVAIRTFIAVHLAIARFTAFDAATPLPTVYITVTTLLAPNVTVYDVPIFVEVILSLTVGVALVPFRADTIIFYTASTLTVGYIVGSIRTRM